MKKIAFLLFSVILSEVSAQCDNPYYQLKEGTLIVMENFDKKDKLQGKTESKVTKFDETSTGFTATISAIVYDKKDKITSEGDYELKCENGSIKIDMSGLIPAESMAAFRDMEIDVTMDQLEYPSNLEAGQILNDASIEIAVSGSSMPMKLIFDITDRKVEGKETITTPAGTFECYKISYNTHSKMMIINMNMRNVEYLSDKFGAVKTETYKSNGNLIGYTLITKYEY